MCPSQSVRSFLGCGLRSSIPVHNPNPSLDMSPVLSIMATMLVNSVSTHEALSNKITEKRGLLNCASHYCCKIHGLERSTQASNDLVNLLIDEENQMPLFSICNQRTFTMAFLGCPGLNFADTIDLPRQLYFNDQKFQLLWRFFHTRKHPRTCLDWNPRGKIGNLTRACVFLNKLAPLKVKFNFTLLFSNEAAGKPVPLVEFCDPGSNHQPKNPSISNQTQSLFL